MFKDENFFQILVIAPNQKETNNVNLISSSYNIKTKLMMEKKQDFQDSHLYPMIKYDSDSKSWQQGGTIGDTLPTKGVIVNKEFLKFLGNDDEDLAIAEFATVRFLLQTRKISQLVAKTWLSPDKFEQEWEKDNLMYIREVILSSSLQPDEPKNINDLFTKLSPDDKTDYIIKPGMRNLNGIRLNLLLAGQAYRWISKGQYNNDIEGYLLVCDSLTSTYETVYEYAWQVSWDTFYASRIDISQPGLNPIPPYYDVTLAYPPRPSLDSITSLTEEKIQAWADASEEQGRFPFYPNKSDGTYTSNKLEFTVPPYPYIPMSCGC